MPKVFPRIVIIDVESTCWKEGEQPPGQSSEIIEVGLAVIRAIQNENENDWIISESNDFLVKPAYSKVSPFCTELTTLTQDMVDQGWSFDKVCDTIARNYESKVLAWASWGDYDRKQFERCCRSQYCNYPFGPTHFNLKYMHAIMHGLKRQLSMAEALRFEGFELEGTHHRAGDDAKNIAKLACKIFGQLTGN